MFTKIQKKNLYVYKNTKPHTYIFTKITRKRYTCTRCVLNDQSTKIWFLDQQKSFDRVEWGWVDHVPSKFNFGEQFREWVQMLFNYAQICIKTNGFVSKYFNISRSCSQCCTIVPLVYILQAELVACAIRGDSEKQGVKLHGGKDGEYIETKLCMSADDTQLFNKNDECQKIF